MPPPEPDPFAAAREAQAFLDKITRATRSRQRAADDITTWVGVARALGATWTQIGAALATTRTAAQKRYATPKETP